jgi:hypothetical protein
MEIIQKCATSPLQLRDARFFFYETLNKLTRKKTTFGSSICSTVWGSGDLQHGNEATWVQNTVFTRNTARAKITIVLLFAVLRR